MPALLNHITSNTPLGCNLAPGGATFRVWAPNATAVHVRGSFNGFNIQDDALLLSGGNGYWHGYIPGVAEFDTYKFWITGPAGPGMKRDPYARELDGPNWDCLVRDASFPWHETGFRTPDFHNLVIYQLHVGAFYAPRWPKSAGRFLDVIDKISDLAALGVTAIQLMPIQEFPGDFSLGYNGTDYFSAEMAYGVPHDELPPYLAQANDLLAARHLAPYAEADLRGEMNQLKALIDLCHVHGLAVIFDLVFNHAGGRFGDETLWFFDRQTGVEEPRWWNSLYFSDRTWAGGVVFNFQSNPVRAFLIDNAKYFLDEFRVDGFRFDEVSVIDREGLGRGWDFCQDMTATLRTHRPGAVLHAEYWNVNPWIVREKSEGGAGFDTTMTDGPRIAIRNLLGSASVPGEHPLPMTDLLNQIGMDYLRARWRGVNSLENHDLVLQPKSADDHDRMERIARVADPQNPRSWWARSRARVANGLLLTMPGIPMLFMGQEFLEDKQWSDDVSGHPELLLFWAGLNGPDPIMRNFRNFIRELIQLRWRQPALRGEGFARIHAHDQNRVLAFHRWVPDVGGDLIIVASFASRTWSQYQLGFPRGGRWLEIFNSEAYDTYSPDGNGGQIQATGGPMHGLSASAWLTIPANSLLVFGAA